MSARPRHAASLAIVVGVVGCFAATALATTLGERTAGSQEVVVTRNNGRGPDSCRPRAIGERLVDFSKALRGADMPTLRGVWNHPFEWFFINLRKGPDIYAREPREALAEVRRRGGLPLRLSEVDVDFDRSWGYPAVDISYGGSWGPKRRKVHGKGFMLCKRPTIRVWGMAVGRQHKPHRFGKLCPGPPAGTDPRSLVACTRRR